ncbi:MAG TPA: 5-oxoprolinase subunit PxpB [Pyrinomonadaceae bacterium]|nr:5-oxoprolinase subunit PxpB [Pyrinomonadaceae bacterium]
MKNYRFFPVGENALTVEFGNVIDENLNRQVIALGKYLTENPFHGLLEIVPAYASLTVFFNVLKVKKHYSSGLTAFETVGNLLSKPLEKLKTPTKETSKLVEIPIIIDEESSPDLAFVAEINKLSIEKVIEIFLAETYRVYMLGFLPGFAYMGEVDAQISAPRKESPRQTVRAGSVGIAGTQTGIYPFDSPGGWQIIGRTEIKLFDQTNEKPTLFEVGDSVKFIRL